MQYLDQVASRAPVGRGMPTAAAFASQPCVAQRLRPSGHRSRNRLHKLQPSKAGAEKVSLDCRQGYVKNT